MAETKEADNSRPELSVEDIWRAVAALERREADKILAAIKKGCRIVDGEAGTRTEEACRKSLKKFLQGKEKEKKMKERVVKKFEITLGDDFEDKWVAALEIFGSDYARTYRALLDRERSGERISDFSEYPFYHRAEIVKERLPEYGSVPQNAPFQLVYPPEKYGVALPTNEYGQTPLFFYASNSGCTVLSFWRGGEQPSRIVLELFEGSSFLEEGEYKKSLGPFEKKRGIY